MWSPNLSPSSFSPGSIITGAEPRSHGTGSDTQSPGPLTPPLSRFAPLPHGQLRLSLASPIQKFEFINNKDADSTRRAKSHATKDFKRRQKAESVRYLKLKDGAKKRIASAPPSPDLDFEEANLECQRSSVHRRLETVLDGSTDPFNLFPVKLHSHNDRSLVQHYHSVFSPKPFQLANSDYSPFRSLTLKVVIRDPASFLILVSGAAEDIALRRKEPVPQNAIAYKGKAMSMVNSRMLDPEKMTDDGAITAACILAGWELLFGVPEVYEIHTNGLCQLLKLRGGLQVLQATNPLLVSLISWHDYAGTAALAGKRRFEFTSLDSTATSFSTKPLRFKPPLNIPRFTLPKTYTLYDDLMILLEGLENATALCQITPSIDKKRLKNHTNYIQKLNEDLIRILSPQTKQTTPFRRFLIEDSFRLVALIYISALCKDLPNWTDHCDNLVDAVKLELIPETGDWGNVILKIVQFLMTGRNVHEKENVDLVVQLMDIAVPLDWSAWLRIRDRLRKFLLEEEVCAGKYQDLWLCRVSVNAI